MKTCLKSLAANYYEGKEKMKGHEHRDKLGDYRKISNANEPLTLRSPFPTSSPFDPQSHSFRWLSLFGVFPFRRDSVNAGLK
jgi:hypothetical protein